MLLAIFRVRHWLSISFDARNLGPCRLVDHMHEFRSDAQFHTRTCALSRLSSMPVHMSMHMSMCMSVHISVHMSVPTGTVLLMHVVPPFRPFRVLSRCRYLDYQSPVSALPRHTTGRHAPGMLALTLNDSAATLASHGPHRPATAELPLPT